MTFVLMPRLLLFYFTCASVFAYPCVRNDDATAQVRTRHEKRSKSLHLTMKIIDQKYCVGDSELDGLAIKAKLIYNNIGEERIIFYKSSNLVSRIMISRSPEDAIAKRFEVNSSITWVSDGSRTEVKALSPGKMFVILPPGASYEAETVVSVLVVRDDTCTITGAVTSGPHFLQVEVSTWPESEELAIKLRYRWRRSGFLWYDGVVSAPVPFTVQKERLLVPCL